MAVDRHCHFVKGLALFFFCGESANGGSRTLRRHRLFDSRRKVRPLDFLFLGGGGTRKQQATGQKRYQGICLHDFSSTRGMTFASTQLYRWPPRSEEHTSELQSHLNLV